jgi:hypothetical protein
MFTVFIKSVSEVPLTMVYLLIFAIAPSFSLRLPSYHSQILAPRYTRQDMKPLPSPPVPGKTESERFDNAVRKTFTVSKEEMQRRESEWQRAQAKKTESKKAV